METIIVDSLNIIKTKTTPKENEVTPRNMHSLSYRLKGENILCSNNSTFISGVGTLTLVPKGISYLHNIIAPSEQIVANFTTKHNLSDTIRIFKLPLYCDMENLFISLYNQWELEQKESNIQCMAIFYNILALLARNINSNDDKKSKLLFESIQYMHQHYRESDFNISKLHEQTYISPAYYRRIFNEVYKCSPIEYLKKLRLNYAKQLIYSGHYTISEIAELSGFSTPTYFSYEFKKQTGYSPSKYIGNNDIANR